MRGSGAHTLLLGRVPHGADLGAHEWIRDSEGNSVRVVKRNAEVAERYWHFHFTPHLDMEMPEGLSAFEVTSDTVSEKGGSNYHSTGLDYEPLKGAVDLVPDDPEVMLYKAEGEYMDVYLSEEMIFAHDAEDVRQALKKLVLTPYCPGDI